VQLGTGESGGSYERQRCRLQNVKPGSEKRGEERVREARRGEREPTGKGKKLTQLGARRLEGKEPFQGGQFEGRGGGAEEPSRPRLSLGLSGQGSKSVLERSLEKKD